MSRGQRGGSSSHEAEFQTYRATAPETVSDKKIRDIMKEHNYKQSKIAEVIQDWWDNPPEVVEEWVLSGKQKKATQPESQNNATERRTPGNAGRGRTREGGAGGRGAGAAGRGGDRPADRKRDSRSASPRAGDKSQAVEGTEDPVLGNVPAPVAAAPAWGARKSASAGGANKGSDSAPASSSGPSRERKDRERVSKSKSKENSNGINLNVASNLPAVGIWNSTESAAQRLKRLESEKEAAKKPAEPEPAAIVPEEKEGRTKKKKERSRGGRGGQAAAAAAAEDVPSAAETAAAAPVQTSILENLSNIAGVTGASEGAQTSEADNTAESPKVGLKMGKWEAKSDRIGEGESLSFGSFGNTSNLTSSSPGASASAWGSSAPESQAETMDAVSSAWSGAQGAGGDSLGKADEGDKSDMPPGLSSGSASMGVSAGKGGPRSGMPNQGRGKPEDSQFSQSQPSASAQPTNFYQQPPGIGAGVRSNIGLAAGPYGTQNFDQSAQYAQTGFQAQAPGASGISGSASSATGSAASPNLPLQQGQQPQQPPQQPPGYAQQPAGMPAYYYNNPYYPQYPYYSQTPMGVQPQPYFQGRGNFPGGRGGYSDVYSNVYQQQQQQQQQQQPQQQQPQQGQQQGQQGQQSGGDFTSGQQSGQFDGMQKGQSQLNGQGGPGGNKPSGGSDSATQQQSMPYNGYINPNPYTAAQSNWTGYSQSAGGYGTPMMYPGSSGAAGQSSFPGQQLPGQPHQQGQSGRDSNRNNNPRGWGM